MKKLYQVLGVLALVCMVLPVSAQITVYNNLFPDVGLPAGVSFGTPPVGATVYPAATSPTSGFNTGGSVSTTTFDDNQLALWVAGPALPPGPTNDHAYVMFDASGFSAPYNTILSSNVGVVTWTFNMRTSTPATGFSGTQDIAAVVLAATSPEVYATGSGYAVTYNPGVAGGGGIQLVKYSGGLTGSITPVILSSMFLSLPTNYASFRVTYDPYTNKWELFVRDDGSGGFLDPTIGVTISGGSIVDGTYTGSAGAYTGCYANYSVPFNPSGSPLVKFGYFDNFRLTVTCPEITGGLLDCVGSTITLNDLNAGGTWSSGATGIATIDASTGIVTGIAGGTANITYTNSVCVVSATVTVNTPPSPSAIFGTATVCVGSTTPLFNGTPGGSWSSGNVALGTISSGGVVTGISDGVVPITYAIPGHCFATINVTVNPISPISGLANMCEGQTATFHDLAPDGTWSSSDDLVATVDPTGLVTAQTLFGPTTTATISYVTSAGCEADMTITVNPLPLEAFGATSICEGFSTTLISPDPDPLAWSSSPGTIADVDGALGGIEVINGFSAGTATITYKKLTTGCARTVVVTVNPAADITSTALTVCVNATITLNGTPAGGEWSSTELTNATVDPISGVVTGLAAGTTIISYVMPTGCFRFVTVNVNPIPDPISGTLSVCKNATTSLSSGPLAGTWSSSVTANGTIDASGVVTGIAPGTTTISYTFTSTGCFNTAEVTVNDLPTPITNNTTTICEGATRTLGSGPAGGTWSSGGTGHASIGSSSGIVSGTLAGNENITYTAPVTGCIATTIMTVIPQPAVITGNLSVCVGLTTTLNTTTSVTWSSGNLALGTVNSSTGVVTTTATGDLPIIATGGNGCTRTAIVTVNPLPANISGGTSPFCGGNTITLGNTSPGGTWSTGGSSVAFFTVSTSSVLTGSSFITSQGTATVSYTLPTGCRKTIVVTVNPLPASITPNPASVCVGLTIALNSTTTGGTWSSSPTSLAPGTVSSSGVVTGITQGTINVTYTLTATGCFRTREVSVNPLPNAITGPTTVCPGTTITLSSTPTTGTWSTTTPVSNVSVDFATGDVTGATSGTATVTYTLPTNCFITTVVTVSPAPPAIITPLGDTALCPGDFVTLTGSTSPGVTYQWFNGPTAIPGATLPTYLTYTAGNYQIKVTITSGCSTISAPMSVSVVPAAATISTPGGTTSGCSGTGILLTGTSGTGMSYQWMSGGSPISGATDATYTALTSGDYSLVVSNSTGCSATSPSETITIHPVPSGIIAPAGPLAVCTGNTVTMTTDPGLTSYQWYHSPGTAISGATTASYTTGAADDYWVVATNSFGCSTTSAHSTLVVNPLPDVTISHPGGNTVFCTGGSVHLFAVPGAGFNYQWYNGTTAIPGATNDNYIASTGGPYKVRITNPATGCMNMTGTATTVTVVSSPTVTPLTPARFCWGGNSILTTSVSSVGSAVSYQWFLNSVAITGATGSSYTATVPGLYSCAISVPASCIATTSTIPVYENPLPDPLVTFDGSMFHAQGYYVTYQWYKGTVMIPGATASSTPATSNGSYKVAVTDTNGCQAMSTFYVLTNWNGSTNGITAVNESTVKIYPNPANMMVHVESDVQVRAVITSMDGRQLMNIESAKDIDLSKLANGVYMIMIYDNAQQLLKTDKLIKNGE